MHCDSSEKKKKKRRRSVIHNLFIRHVINLYVYTYVRMFRRILREKWLCNYREICWYIVSSYVRINGWQKFSTLFNISRYNSYREIIKTPCSPRVNIFCSFAYEASSIINTIIVAYACKYILYAWILIQKKKKTFLSPVNQN